MSEMGKEFKQQNGRIFAINKPAVLFTPEITAIKLWG